MSYIEKFRNKVPSALKLHFRSNMRGSDAVSYKTKKIARLSSVLIIMALFLSACTRYEPAALEPGYDASAMQETTAISFSLLDEAESESQEETAEAETEAEAVPEEIDTRMPTRVKGLYIASKPVGNESFMNELFDVLDSTELNAVVIDIKDDYGRISYAMQGVELVDELGSVDACIDDMPAMMQKFKEHNVYTIARIVSMRDPYIGKVKPEWCLTNQDGTIYTDNSGYTWINPYKTEYWDYLLDIGRKCAEDGFDEIQFDYIRFCTDKGASDCIFDEEETKGRDKISIISEAVQYLSDNLRSEGVFVSCDVFGTIIGSRIDSRAVGQDYPQMAALVDYMCPMIYPSHYAANNFGLDMPDKHPHDAILGALKLSRNALASAFTEGGDYGHQAVVRPWLQAFTASWLGSGNYISYGVDEIRQEIQAVYDAGYDEWILWSASASYDYSGFLSDAEAKAEDTRIEESRAALPLEEDPANEEETFPKELQDALDGDELRPEDEEILLQDGPIVSYE